MSQPERCRQPDHDGLEGECYACAREAEAAGSCGNCYGNGSFGNEPGCFCEDDRCPADHMGMPIQCRDCKGSGSRAAQLAAQAARKVPA